MAAGAYCGALAFQLWAWGLPIDREQVLAWICGALVVAGLGRPWRSALRLVVDWIPLALVLLAYDFSRGAADGLGISPHVAPQRDADRLLFGWLLGGDVPTVWLQEHLLQRTTAQWELVVALLYVSHYFVVFVVAGVLWFRDRARWVGFVSRFVTLNVAAVATFVLFPAMPPWLAAEQGHLGTVERVSTRGWRLLELDIASRLLEKGQASVNLVAAIPSLHAAYPMLVTLFFWRVAAPWLRAVLVAYTVAMGWALVWSGEHWAVDVFLGWGYAAATMALWGVIERRRSTRRRCAPDPVLATVN